MCSRCWMVLNVSLTRYTKSWFLFVHWLIKIWFHANFPLGLLVFSSALAQFLVRYLYGQKHVCGSFIILYLINFLQFLIEEVHLVFGVIIHGSRATRCSIFGFSPWQVICGKVVICLLSRWFLVELCLCPARFKHAFIPWETGIIFHQWLVPRIFKLVIAFGALRR